MIPFSYIIRQDCLISHPHIFKNPKDLWVKMILVLLILRILYDEKKRELSAIEEVIVNLGDIQDKFLSLKIRDKIIDKTTMRNALNLFRRYQIVELLDKDMGDEESRILIYDSILMAVRADDIKAAYEKLETYRKGKNTNDEETDEDEADQLAQI